MDQKLIFWPVLVQVLLSLLLYVPLVRAKIKAYKRREVDRDRSALCADAWPDYVQKVNNNIRNQFETPMLFYVLALTLYVTQQVTIWGVVLAWLYVVSRLAHMWVHIGSNYVPLRMRLFAAGLGILLVLTLVTALAIVGV